MNKQRRNALNALQDRLTALNLADVLAAVKDIRDEIETLRDEEQDALDNLPDSLQEGEKGQLMQDAIGYMETAMEQLEPLADAADGDAYNEAHAAIEDAKGAA